MAIQARVTSTDALESFRSSLIIFIARARMSVNDAADEVRRMRSWLQNEQWLRWEGEIRRRVKALDQAQHELRNAQFADNRTSAVQTRQAAVQRAKQAVAEAEGKLLRVKKWNQNFEHTTDPALKRLESFRQFVEDDLPKAVAHLSNVRKALEAYAESGAPAPAAGLADASAFHEPGEPPPSPEPPSP